MKYDVAIVGAGLVGLASARALSLSNPGCRIAVLEKEDGVAKHQSGRNSGVIHSGIYYKPGSQKASTCFAGAKLLRAYCQAKGIQFDNCGKVILATDPKEFAALEEIQRRGIANQVSSQLLSSPEEIKSYEPFAEGQRGLHVPSTGIVDYRGLAKSILEELSSAGVQVITNFRLKRVDKSENEWRIQSDTDEMTSSFILNCGGLYSDRIAKKCGVNPGLKIVPFRGEYFKLAPESTHLCKNLIYPVPDPAFPFLGVHLTRMIDGGVECGPNAVFAFAREGYSKSRVVLGEAAESIAYRGFLRLASKFWKVGLYETARSLSKPLFAKDVQRLVPDLKKSDLVAGGAGVRAQAVRPNGALVDDFEWSSGPSSLHVLNAPSPAATACLAIGETIAKRVVLESGLA